MFRVVREEVNEKRPPWLVRLLLLIPGELYGNVDSQEEGKERLKKITAVIRNNAGVKMGIRIVTSINRISLYLRRQKICHFSVVSVIEE